MATKKNKRVARYGERPNGRPRILVLEGLMGGAECVRDAGGEAFAVNPRRVEEVDKALRYGIFHGLLLTGGGDVDPRLYGEHPHKAVYGVSEMRDRVEMYALRIARERGWPVMGICRGAQIMAVEAGGSLYQHIEGHRNSRHLVTADAGSTFRKASGHNAMHIVSLHHQEIHKPGRQMAVTGYAVDGTVEAIESNDGRCLGVQFHPEMAEYQPYSRNLFRWLVTESAKRAGIATPHWPEPFDAVETHLEIREQLRRESKKVKVQQRRTRRAKARANQLQLPVALTATPKRSDRTVKTSWMCPQCAIQFDNLKDREDHVHILHRKSITTGGK